MTALRPSAALALVLLIAAAPWWLAQARGADQPLSTPEAAARLIAGTVTVRCQRGTTSADGKTADSKATGGASEQAAAPQRAPSAGPAASARSSQALSQAQSGQAATADEVSVASGVAVAPGFIVTFSPPEARRELDRVRYRVTLADGQQTKAALAVLDHYSGLALLAIEADVPALPLALEEPAPGAAVLTAAASGIERPLVSQGIVSGLDRALPGTDLPPLVQCDVLTTDTSPGAGVLALSGKLLGVIVAVTRPGERGGWAFAVPARHVRRLLEARQPGQLVVLERRRPTVGLTLGPGAREGMVVVERVVPGGPAAEAGIRAGDVVLEAQGRKLRSAYQAVDLIMNRQPGETISLLVEQNAAQRKVDVVLRGAAAAPPADVPAQAGALVGPQVNLRRVGPSQIEVRGNVAELSLPAGSQAPRERAPLDEVTMLRTQLTAFGKVIERLQQELERRAALEAELRATVESLDKQVTDLRRRLGPADAGGRLGVPQPVGPAAPGATPAR